MVEKHNFDAKSTEERNYIGWEPCTTALRESGDEKELKRNQETGNKSLIIKSTRPYFNLVSDGTRQNFMG